jgi:hypothetical protein
VSKPRWHHLRRTFARAIHVGADSAKQARKLSPVAVRPVPLAANNATLISKLFDAQRAWVWFCHVVAVLVHGSIFDAYH